jgi:hypothetical protein
MMNGYDIKIVDIIRNASKRRGRVVNTPASYIEFNLFDCCVTLDILKLSSSWFCIVVGLNESCSGMPL